MYDKTQNQLKIRENLPQRTFQVVNVFTEELGWAFREQPSGNEGSAGVIAVTHMRAREQGVCVNEEKA